MNLTKRELESILIFRGSKYESVRVSPGSGKYIPPDVAQSLHKKGLVIFSNCGSNQKKPGR